MTEDELIQRNLKTVEKSMRNAFRVGYAAGKENNASVCAAEFQRGFEEGKAQGGGYDAGYEDGASQLWELVCRIAAPVPVGMSQDEVIEAFDCAFCDIFDGRFSYQDIVLKMKAYDEKKAAKRNELHIGDEVLDCSGNRCVITNIDTSIHVPYAKNGKTHKWGKKSRFQKTGKHYETIDLTFLF